MEFFESLDTLLKTFWFVALPASLIFIGQTIMTFLGADASDGVDADFDGDFEGGEAPFQLFSLRNLINFLLGFSWTGISFYDSISNKNLLIGIAVLVGALFVYFFFLIIRQIQKLAEDNSFRIEETLNLLGEVYLTIPGNMKGKGKVMVSVRGAMHELEALTEEDAIASGAMVRVVRIENKNLLVVESL
jgi:hypothetical protein